MDWQAKWIWEAGDDAAPRNVHVNFRREFALPETYRHVVLHVSADSRYQGWVNAEYLGHGPVRGWPGIAWRFDSYDITAQCLPGANCLALQVHSFGIGTMQYVLARAGLVAQVECDGQVVCATDGDWLCCRELALAANASRINLQMAWAEIYDARRAHPLWQRVGFHHASWRTVHAIGQVGLPPWGKLQPRDIPLLTQDPVAPARLLAARVAQPPILAHAVELSSLPGSNHADPTRPATTGLLATELENETHGPLTLHLATAHRPLTPGAVRVNGEDVPITDGIAEITAPIGRTILLIDSLGPSRYDCCVYPLLLPHSDPDIRLISPLDRDAPCPWVYLGPYADTPADQQQKADDFAITNGVALTASDRIMPIPAPCFSPENTYGLTYRAAYLPDTHPALREPDAFLAPSPDFTRIEPHPHGDVELLIDFGREVVGFLELQLCATGGTVIDINAFEYMQPLNPDVIQWTEGLNNTLRYTCRDGWQTFRSSVRRGLRYLTLTIRFPPDADPLLLRHLRCYQNTYPYTRRGLFACSDEALNRIWEMSAYTTRLCSEDTFVDCPGYEQTFWVGDARNEALFAYTAYGDYALARRCLLLAGDSLDRSPFVQSQVPSVWENTLTTWSLLWIIACHEHLWWSDDLLFAGQIYPRIRQQADTCLDHLTDTGLFHCHAWHLLDWAGMDTPDDAIVSHVNMWLVIAWRRAADLADLLGHSTDAQRWRDAADSLAQAINDQLWDPDRAAFIDSIHADGARSTIYSQQTQVVAFLADICDGPRRNHLASYLAGVPDGWVVAGSPFMLAFVIEALARDGQFDTILDIIRGAWGLMLGADASTCWETFPKWDEYGQPGKWLTRSHCHAWSAAPAYALPTFILGIEPLGRGFRRFSVEPRLQDLTWARAIVPTPHGPITVEASRDDSALIVDMTVPDTTVAELFGEEFGPGRHTIQLDGGLGTIR